MKNMSPHIAEFVKEMRQSTGLVVLPAEFDPMDEENYKEGYDKTPEGKAALSKLKAQGIEALVKFHLGVVYNNQVSLKRDVARHDPSNDPGRLAAIEASPGELESMRLVAKYRKMGKDAEENKAKEVEKLLEQIGPAASK